MISLFVWGEVMQEVENIVCFMEMLKVIGGDQFMVFEMDLEKVMLCLGDLMNVLMDLCIIKEQKVELKKVVVV